MADMDGWSVALLAVAGYVAVVVLVRMMNVRRDRLMAEFREKFAAEKQKKKREAAQAAEAAKPRRNQAA
jgi:hypothetical protein